MSPSGIFEFTVQQQAISESLGPLYQNEVKYSVFDKGIIFHSHAK